ncbi:MAG TPA: DUF4870 domain-containing protein [Longimicrobium sp.]|jgi:uncharacterized membrane protein|uniref:DUF4870 domain-containing protein n=1 Tax=Longimicrobium sp. TaxID=2029185 RepID=UPI002ED935C3
MSNSIQHSSGNVSAAIAAAVPPITGATYLFAIKDQNPLVRFHAAQNLVFGAASIGLNIVLSIVFGVLTRIPALGLLFGLISIPVYLAIAVASFGIWVYTLMKAYNGQEWEIPIIGAQARKLLVQPALHV